MSHSDIKYSDIYSDIYTELFRYISDIKLVPTIRLRPPNVHSKYIILPVFGILTNRCLASSASVIVGQKRELEVLVGNCSFSRLNNNDCVAIVMILSSLSLKNPLILYRYMYDREYLECQ